MAAEQPFGRLDSPPADSVRTVSGVSRGQCPDGASDSCLGGVPGQGGCPTDTPPQCPDTSPHSTCPTMIREKRADSVRARPRLKEDDFRRQIVGPKGLATILGWLHVGFRPAMTTHGWRTPGTGELAAGWPDLTLVHPVRQRLLFRELKSEDGDVSDDQRRVLMVLVAAGLDAGVWRPRDLDSGEIQRVLQ